MEDRAQQDLSGTLIDGRYQIIERIGQGGRATVYKAEQVNLNRIVAIKVLSDDVQATPEHLSRFQLEAKIASQLQHENLVATYSFGVLPDGRPYLVLQYVNAATLESYLQKENAFTPQELQNIFLQICQALSVVHAAGVVHRDISPTNIFVERKDDAWKAYLADFGLAKIMEDGLNTAATSTQSAGMRGTPRFMSPEQCSNSPLDPRSDIYSLSALIYYAYLGHAPFEADNDLMIMHKHIHESAVISEKDRKILGTQLSRLLLKCLDKNRELRIQTAAALHDSLAKITPADSSGSTLLSVFKLSAAALGLLIVGAGVFQFTRMQSNHSETSKEVGFVRHTNSKSKRSHLADHGNFKAHINSVQGIERESENTYLQFSKLYDTAQTVQRLQQIRQEIDSRLAQKPSEEDLQSLVMSKINCQLCDFDLAKRRNDRAACLQIIANIRTELKSNKMDLRKVEADLYFHEAAIAQSDAECKKKLDAYLAMSVGDNEDSRPAYTSLLNISLSCLHQGRYELLANYADKMLSSFKEGTPHFEIKRRIISLALAYVAALHLDKTAQAAKYEKEFLQLFKKYTKDSSLEMFDTLNLINTQAGEAEIRKHYDDAEYLQTLAVKATADAASPLHSKFIEMSRALVDLYMREGKVDEVYKWVRNTFPEINGDIESISDEDIGWVAMQLILSKHVEQGFILMKNAIGRPSIPPGERAIYRLQLGVCLNHLNKRDEAIPYFESWMEAADQTGNAWLKCEALMVLFERERSRKQHEKARFYCQEYCKLLTGRTASLPGLQVGLHQMQARLYFDEKKYDQALAEYEQVLALAKADKENMQNEYKMMKEVRNRSKGVKL